MACQAAESFLSTVFGSGEGSGAAMVMCILGVAGTVLCLLSGKKLSRYQSSDPSEETALIG